MAHYVLLINEANCLDGFKHVPQPTVNYNWPSLAHTLNASYFYFQIISLSVDQLCNTCWQKFPVSRNTAPAAPVWLNTSPTALASPAPLSTAPAGDVCKYYIGPSVACLSVLSSATAVATQQCADRRRRVWLPHRRSRKVSGHVVLLDAHSVCPSTDRWSHLHTIEVTRRYIINGRSCRQLRPLRPVMYLVILRLHRPHWPQIYQYRSISEMAKCVIASVHQANVQNESK